MAELTAGKSKVMAGLLAVFPPTGALGIHRFYLGSMGLGLLHVVLLGGGLVLSIIGIGIPIVVGNLIWAFIEGIMIFPLEVSSRHRRASLP